MTILRRIARKAMKMGLGVDVVALDRDLRSAQKELSTLKGVLERMGESPEAAWLYKNRILRMDPSVDFFDEARREFHLDRYRFAAGYVAGKVVADIACGTGYGTEILVTTGNAARAYGVDIDPDAVKYAGAHHGSPEIEFIAASGDATGIPAESVDVVVSFETIEHVPDDRSLLAEFSRILKPGGTLISSTPNMWPLEMAPEHVRVYDESSYRQVLNEHFTAVRMFNQNSGGDSPFNRGQSRGIVETTPENSQLAECFVAICVKR